MVDLSPRRVTPRWPPLQLAHPASHFTAALTTAATALAAGDAETAYALADRVCRARIRRRPAPLLIRAEASLRLGRRDDAARDIEAAFQIDPHETETLNRRLLWCEGEASEDAARRIIHQPAPSPIVARALARLNIEKAAAARTIDGEIIGWVAWRDGPTIDIGIAHPTGGAETLRIAGDPAHQLAAGLGRAAQFSARARGASGLWFGVVDEAGALRLEPAIAAINADAPLQLSPAPPRLTPLRADTITVIVPVYLDVEATRACLDALASNRAGSAPYHVIVIDDASPDPDIKALLAHYPFTVLTNTANQGFARSVNCGIAAAADGDIVLLNADAILPPGGLDRLADAAYSAADIGTVTPFTNNGELTSLPTPYESNPMPTPDEAQAYDAAARAYPGSQVVDLPSGIGFCLYVRHDCRDAITRLSEDYDRGYGEDVDFCLRAREAGFRSVCATRVFVAHAGTRSFRADKRALVVRNLRRLEARFDTHRAEVAAFRSADPLAHARAAISLAAPSVNETIAAATPSTTVRSAPANGLRLAVLPLTPTAVRPETLTRLARALIAARRNAGYKAVKFPVVVFGSTAWDEILMASGLVHVVGDGDPDDLASDFARYGVASAWLPAANADHPMQRAAEGIATPLASTSLAFPLRSCDGDLQLSPVVAGESLAAVIAAWHEASIRRPTDTAQST